MRRARGFSLLEVLVAVAILGLGLTAILSAQAGSFASAAHARNISTATGLLRCKMSELEEHLIRDGFQDTDENGSGPCCDNEETPNMRCAWRIERPVFPDAKFGELNLGGGLDLKGPGNTPGSNPLAAFTGAFGAMSSGGTGLGSTSNVSDIAKTLADANSTAASAASSYLPPPVPSSSASPQTMVESAGAQAQGMSGMIASFGLSIVYPQVKAAMEASTRRITTTLTFKQGKKEYSIDVVEWYTIPNPGIVSNDQLEAASAASSGTPSAGTTKPPVAKPPSGLTTSGKP